MDPIKELRKRLRGRTQRSLADEVGVSSQYLNDILSGRREPGPAILAGLGLERVVSYRRSKGNTGRLRG
jgi:transcriptional regulator with XRE-family HTH domain